MFGYKIEIIKPINASQRAASISQIINLKKNLVIPIATRMNIIAIINKNIASTIIFSSP